MPTQRWGSCVLVAEVRWRRLALRCLVHVTRASWQIVLDSWHQASSRIAQTECTHLPELLVHRANQWASMDVCGRKRGGCGAIMNYVHSAASIAHKEAKARMKGKKKEVTTISQRAAQIVEGAHTKEKEDVACPRCDRELYVFQHRFRTDSTLSWMDPRRNTLYIDQSVPQRGRRSWRVAEYQPYRRWKFSEWFWWPRNTPKTRRWHTGSTPCKRLDAQVQALAANPAWAQEQFAQWYSISIFNINSSSWRRRRRILGKCFPRTADPLRTGGVWTRGWIGLVCNRPIQHNVRARKRESSTGLEW